MNEQKTYELSLMGDRYDVSTAIEDTYLNLSDGAGFIGLREKGVVKIEYKDSVQENTIHVYEITVVKPNIYTSAFIPLSRFVYELLDVISEHVDNGNEWLELRKIRLATPIGFITNTLAGPVLSLGGYTWDKDDNPSLSDIMRAFETECPAFLNTGVFDAVDQDEIHFKRRHHYDKWVEYKSKLIMSGWLNAIKPNRHIYTPAEKFARYQLRIGKAYASSNCKIQVPLRIGPNMDQLYMISKFWFSVVMRKCQDIRGRITKPLIDAMEERLGQEKLHRIVDQPKWVVRCLMNAQDFHGNHNLAAMRDMEPTHASELADMPPSWWTKVRGISSASLIWTIYKSGGTGTIPTEDLTYWDRRIHHMEIDCGPRFDAESVEQLSEWARRWEIQSRREENPDFNDTKPFNTGYTRLITESNPETEEKVTLELLSTPQSMVIEGEDQHHCIGSSHHINLAREGKACYYKVVYVNGDKEERLSMELRPSVQFEPQVGEPTWDISQLYGSCNVAASPEALKFITSVVSEMEVPKPVADTAVRVIEERRIA